MNNLAINKEDSLIVGLNPQQKEAVEHVEGPILVFAGAGSGKTRVLTRRIANLISNHQVYPSRILAVTFTNKAAGEMRERISALLGQSLRGVWAQTFHSACLRMLRMHAKDLGYTQQFAVYDTSDSRSLLKRVYKKLNIDPKRVDPRTVLGMIDKAKNNFQGPEDIRESFGLTDENSEIIANIFETYQSELLSSNAMDFGDLLCNALSLLKLNSGVREYYQNKFQHILVDEYQDTNKVQYLLIKLLAEKHQNICAVGDDDQSIYAFRGATVKNILNFSQDYPEAKVVTLSHNYRSSANILKVANAVIADNKNRQKKEMLTSNPEGEKVLAVKTYDEVDEAEFIVREISSLLSLGTPPNEIAVFYRTNAQSRALEEKLFESQVPYEIYGSHKFYERKEIKDILAYFRLLLNEQDNESFLRVINTPARGIGETSVGRIIAFATENKLTFLEASRVITEKKPNIFSGALVKRLSEFLVLIDNLQKKTEEARELLELDNYSADDSDVDFEEEEEGAEANKLLVKNAAIKNSAVQENSLYARSSALAELLESIAKDSGYLNKLKSEDTLESESRIENIQELFRVALDFVRNNSREDGSMPSLEDFLDRASLATDLDKMQNQSESHVDSQGGEVGEKKDTDQNKGSESKGSVSLMTLHLAKGLEFDFVFLSGLEEGLLPHVRSLDNKLELEEERRLFYVGVTRAKKKLYITRATDRSSYARNNWQAGRPSQFIWSIPQEVVKDQAADFFEEW